MLSRREAHEQARVLSRKWLARLVHYRCVGKRGCGRWHVGNDRRR